jgi:hypothetical protein
LNKVAQWHGIASLTCLLIQCSGNPALGNFMAYSVHRPKEYEGKGDRRLSKIVPQLRRLLADTQRDFVHNTLRLGTRALQELAGILVDFAEDLHNGNGLWQTRRS